MKIRMCPECGSINTRMIGQDHCQCEKCFQEFFLDIDYPNAIKKLNDRMVDLKNECIYCWAIEFSDIFPQTLNTKIASDELKKYGYPNCICEGLSRIKLGFINEN